jgi:hypothetical protein
VELVLRIRSPELFVAGVALAVAAVALSAAFTSIAAKRSDIEAVDLKPSAKLAAQLERRFQSDAMRQSRRELALSLLRDEQPATQTALAFLDTVGDYSQRGALELHTVRELFGEAIIHYWPAVEQYVVNRRISPDGEPFLYEQLEWVNQAVLMEKAGWNPAEIKSPTPAEIRQFLQGEALSPEQLSQVKPSLPLADGEHAQ